MHIHIFQHLLFILTFKAAESQPPELINLNTQIKLYNQNLLKRLIVNHTIKSQNQTTPSINYTAENTYFNPYSQEKKFDHYIQTLKDNTLVIESEIDNIIEHQLNKIINLANLIKSSTKESGYKIAIQNYLNLFRLTKRFLMFCCQKEVIYLYETIKMLFDPKEGAITACNKLICYIKQEFYNIVEIEDSLFNFRISKAELMVEQKAILQTYKYEVKNLICELNTQALSLYQKALLDSINSDENVKRIEVFSKETKVVEIENEIERIKIEFCQVKDMEPKCSFFPELFDSGFIGHDLKIKDLISGIDKEVLSNVVDDEPGVEGQDDEGENVLIRGLRKLLRFIRIN